MEQGTNTTQTYEKTKYGTDGGGGRQKHGNICFFVLVEGKQARHEDRFICVLLEGNKDFIFVCITAGQGGPHHDMNGL